MTLENTLKQLLSPQELYVRSFIKNEGILVTDPKDIDALFDIGCLTPIFDNDILSRFTFDDSVKAFLDKVVSEQTYPRFPQDTLDRVSIYNLDTDVLEAIKYLNWSLSSSFKTIFFNTDTDDVFAIIIDDPTVYFKELIYEFDVYSKLT